MIQTGTAGALASHIHTFFFRGNQGIQLGHSSQAGQHQAQRDRDTRVIPQPEEARNQGNSNADELRKLIWKELTFFLGASGRPQPELTPPLSEVSGEPESQHMPRPGEEVPQQQGQVYQEIQAHTGGNQQTVESTTRNPGRRMLADEMSQYLEDVNELDNAIIKPTPNLPPLPAKIYKRIKNREYVKCISTTCPLLLKSYSHNIQAKFRYLKAILHCLRSQCMTKPSSHSHHGLKAGMYSPR